MGDFPSQPNQEPARHTATPWRLQTKGNIGNAIEAYAGKHLFDGDDGYRTVALYQGCSSSHLYLEQEANAAANGAFIVEAVNSHASLTARVEELTALVKLQGQEIQITRERDEELEAALREQQAEGIESNRLAADNFRRAKVAEAALREILDLCGHCQPGDELAGAIKLMGRAALPRPIAPARAATERGK